MNSHPLILWLQRIFQLLANFCALVVLVLILIWVGLYFYWYEELDLIGLESWAKFVWRDKEADLRSFFLIYGAIALASVMSLSLVVFFNAKFKKKHELFTRGAELKDARDGRK